MATLAPAKPKSSSAQLAFDPPMAESTLEDQVLDVWEDLAIRGLAECPVCGGSMLPEGCADCFSELS